MEMVNMLVAGSTEHTRKFNFLDPMIICDQVLDSIPCPRIFKSHLRFNQLPDSFLKRNGKIIYILRNPKDVSVSLFSFVQKEGRIKYAGTWGEFFKVFVNGNVAYSSWFDHVLSWEREMEKRRHLTHFVSYEDLQEDAVRELGHISKFLSLNHPNSFLQSVAECSTFTKMRNQNYLYHPVPAEVMDENYVDFLFRKGIVGDWRRWYSEEQCKQLNDAYMAEKLSSVMVDKIFKPLPREKMALDGDKKSQNQQHNDNPMKLTEHNRILYPYYFGQEPRIQLEHIKNIQSKPGDIFVCSYPKSGTHWIMEMVNMLVAGSTEHPKKFNFLDPMIICEQVLDSIPCPRIFQSHLRFSQLPDSFIKGKGKIIYILRNPKDVSVSLYNFVQKEGRMKYNGTWDECFQLFVSGKVAYSSWFDHVVSWEREKEKGMHPIHFVFYEDLKEDAVRELDRISKFLSLNHPNSFLQSVAESSTFTKMKNQNYLYHPFPAEVMDENYADFLFRKGIVGDWRAWFSEEQSNQLDAVYNAEMSGSNLIFNYG